MIDNEKKAAIKTMIRSGNSPKETLEGLSLDDLRRLKSEIEAILPAESLGNINLEHELVEQYTKVKRLQDEVLEDEKIPLNQRAQMAGQVASTLQHLVKMQSEFHTSERFKAIENLMVKFMKKLPKDVAEAFLDEYEGIGA